MEIYKQEPLIGGKQTIYMHSESWFLLFYCGINSEHETKSQENREGVVTLPTPNARKHS
jgi:hypothetical protein